GNRKTFRIAEEQSVTVLPLLHFFAGTDPRAALGLLGLVLVEVARAERTADLVDVLGEADHEELGDLALGVEVRTALFGEVLDELPHLAEIRLARLGAVGVAGLVERQNRSFEVIQTSTVWAGSPSPASRAP